MRVLQSVGVCVLQGVRVCVLQGDRVCACCKALVCVCCNASGCVLLEKHWDAYSLKTKENISWEVKGHVRVPIRTGVAARIRARAGSAWRISKAPCTFAGGPATVALRYTKAVLMLG